MKISSPHHHHTHNMHIHPLPSPTSSTSSSNNGSRSPHQHQGPLPSPTTVTRSDPSNPYPTTFVQADTSSFKQVVQMLTGSTEPQHKPTKPTNSIPPIKPTTKPKPSTKLYERRNNNSFKHLHINPLLPTRVALSSPRNNNNNNNNNKILLSPSMLDFPSLVLSPVTPLIHDPFNRSPASSASSPVVVDKIAEDKAIAEKGFYLHPVSPASEPRLLPLFPLSSPKHSGSSTQQHQHQYTHCSDDSRC